MKSAKTNRGMISLGRTVSASSTSRYASIRRSSASDHENRWDSRFVASDTSDAFLGLVELVKDCVENPRSIIAIP